MAGGGSWPDLPSFRAWTLFPRLPDQLRGQEIQVQRIIQPLFPCSLFICCLPEDLLRDIQEMYIWITTSNRQAYYSHYCASFLGFGAEEEGLALLLQMLKLPSAMKVITTDIKWVKKSFCAYFH